MQGRQPVSKASMALYWDRGTDKLKKIKHTETDPTYMEL